MKVLTKTSIHINLPAKKIWDYVTVPQNLEKYFVGWGPIPAVKKVEVVEGKPMTPGMTQHTTTVDGRVIVEQILTVKKPTYFDYWLISGFGFPFDLIVRKGGGSWTFKPDATGTTIVWKYYFDLTSPLAYPIGALLVKFFYRNAMAACLRAVKRQLDIF